MTDDNVTTLPRNKALTSTERSRLSRQRKAAKKAAVASPAARPATPIAAVAAPVQRDRSSILTLLAALGIASVSAFFSITGLTAIFAGAFWPVVGMGVALECAKLAAVGWLGIGTGGAVLRIAVLALVAVLMLLSAVGSFGFLAASHIAAATEHQARLDARAADVEARKQVQAAALADVERRRDQIDSGIAETIRRGRAAAAMTLRDQMQRERAGLVVERDREARKLASIEVEAAHIRTDRAQLAADDGPVSYIADLLGVGADTAMKWFIFLVAILLDPLACAMLLASTRRRA